MKKTEDGLIEVELMCDWKGHKAGEKVLLDVGRYNASKHEFGEAPKKKKERVNREHGVKRQFRSGATPVKSEE